MERQRIKEAESLDTVHTHTHTHTIFLQKELVDSLERELHFNDQKCSILNKLYNQINNLKIISRNKKKIVIRA